jgi:hypothetical protein
MLTPEQIKRLIVVKLYRLQGCGDRATIVKNIHIIRGMLIALTGKDPGDLDSVPDILDVIEVPYRWEDSYYIDEEWLKQNNIKAEAI